MTLASSATSAAGSMSGGLPKAFSTTGPHTGQRWSGSPQPHRRPSTRPRSQRKRTSPAAKTPGVEPRMVLTSVVPLRPKPVTSSTRGRWSPDGEPPLVTVAPPRPIAVPPVRQRATGPVPLRAIELGVQRLGLGRRPVPRVRGPHARRQRLGAGPLLVRGRLQRLRQRLGERRDVARREEAGAGARRADDLDVRRDVARHDRSAVAGRLQQRERQALEQRGQDEGRGVRVQLLELGAVDVARQHHPRVGRGHRRAGRARTRRCGWSRRRSPVACRRARRGTRAAACSGAFSGTSRPTNST